MMSMRFGIRSLFVLTSVVAVLCGFHHAFPHLAAKLEVLAFVVVLFNLPWFLTIIVIQLIDRKRPRVLKRRAESRC